MNAPAITIPEGVLGENYAQLANEMREPGAIVVMEPHQRVGYPDGNPKTAQGASKVPLHLVPPSATHYLATAFADGAAKYGPYNWREKGVSATVYVGALKRHVDAWFDGEEVSADALVHHLAHAMACCAIILDANSVGMLNDDRPPKGAAGRLQAEFAEARKPAPVERGPRRSVIVHGPQGCGKTRNAAAIAEHFGLKKIVDDWNGRSRIPTTDALVLTNVFDGGPHITVRGMYEREGAKLAVIEYDQAARAAGVSA